jgi:class 3 adenylate cyclase/tetratricopeptide (TPR) repeat protein
MRCPACQLDNREEARFCKRCGTKLERLCPSCGRPVQPDSLFCDECGQGLEETRTEEKSVPEGEGERKQVTVLFSDLSGYTALSDHLDPEEVKEIMTRIFGEIAQVVTKYEGFIEKFVGDAVMALFGVPKIHEDDPVRAIRAAREIHEVVEAISPQFEERLDEPLSMHSGINTGLVVTGAVDREKGAHGVSGDTVNVASRLSGIAKAGEIVVGPETYHQARAHFTFEDLKPTKVKGKTESIQIYKVRTPEEEPRKVHRSHGLRAHLIGRKVEMAQLGEAVARLREGKGTVFSICGDAGTGKSRLVEEFRATLDLGGIQWQEGHAYAYAQNVPYSPLIDLLGRAFRIEEGDPPEKVRERVKSGVENLVGKKADIVPYVGSLYSLGYPEIEGVSPEFWKSRLHEAIQTILTGLARRAPTVICLEDLHWADPSSLDLLRFLLINLQYPTLFLCVYRPPFSLFTSQQLGGMGRLYQEVRLQDLSPSEAQEMMESLLKTDAIPAELRWFIQEKVEGNPFYLEEVMNSLIEAEMLTPSNGGWRLTKAIGESDIPSSVHGVISGRLDRLEKETKRVLQEASVIGRAFLYEILQRITEIKKQIDRSLGVLEQLDLIRTRSLQPDLEYVFKHALTQEVVYNGLLKKERREIHERIARVMEQLFHDRLSEFSETLAFHFTQGQSVLKAVDYLVKSGEKSLARYALDESHQYFKEAFDLLSDKTDRTPEEEGLLIDLLLKWAYVFYYRGDFKGLTHLLGLHEDSAKGLNDRARLGMFYAWFGFALWSREEMQRSYGYFQKALQLGEEIDNQQIIGYACTWLTWACVELGHLDEAIFFGERAQKVSRILPSDPYLYFKSLGGMVHAYWYMGEAKKALEAGKALLDYGEQHSNIRSLVFGHLDIGYSHFIAGDFPSAIECFQRGIQVSIDPLYSTASKFMLGFSYLSSGRFQEAEETLREVSDFSDKFGVEWMGTPAHMFRGVVMIANGDLKQGIRTLEDGKRIWQKIGRKWCHAQASYILGRVYSEIVGGAASISLPKIAKNIGFLAKSIPTAGKKAEGHFNDVIEITKEMGAKALLGQAFLDLGLLHRAKGRKEKARDCIAEAINALEQCEADVYLRQAKEALDSLG